MDGGQSENGIVPNTFHGLRFAGSRNRSTCYDLKYLIDRLIGLLDSSRRFVIPLTTNNIYIYVKVYIFVLLFFPLFFS